MFKGSVSGRPPFLGFALLLIIWLTCLTAIPNQEAKASPQFSGETGLACTACHESPEGGSMLSFKGARFRANGYSLQGLETVSPWRNLSFLLVGFVHLTAAVVWFGTIFYVHLIIRPKTYAGGLPKSEVRLGRLCIVLVAGSGILLSYWRFPSLEAIWTTTFGLVWLIKVGFFLLMVLIAAAATTWLNRRLTAAGQDAAGTSNPVAGQDGREGRPGHIIYNDQIYDVSKSKLWSEGLHMRRHQAGTDLTEAMSGAPHGAEVLERVPDLGPAPEMPVGASPWPQRLFIFLAYFVMVCMLIILLCVAYWNYGHALRPFFGGRSTQAVRRACLDCHQEATPAVYDDWRHSLHAKAGIGCYQCHRTGSGDPDVIESHFDQYQQAGYESRSPEYFVPVSAVVSPKDCSRCHPDEARQYSVSKHANTLEIIWKIDPWLNKGMNSDNERKTGCFACHGTVVTVDEDGPTSDTWPNVGVGRLNPDGSLGSCTSCHTRHRFSVAEARMPEACDQCHLGPDHPQIEIYEESKHGTMYHAYKDEYNWDAAAGTWTPGVDYRSPTCASCHMSGSNGVATTHDVTERLSWEIQAPLTVRPSEFAPFPAKTNWKVERGKMQAICKSCHSENWVQAHYDDMDKAVEEYNEVYFKPAKAKLDELYEKGIIGEEQFFDEHLEVQFYELWHHEGRRARMGAAMMAPDYAWWHGFYECKQRYNEFMEEANELISTGEKAHDYEPFPGASGDTTRPEALFGEGGEE